MGLAYLSRIIMAVLLINPVIASADQLLTIAKVNNDDIIVMKKMSPNFATVRAVSAQFGS